MFSFFLFIFIITIHQEKLNIFLKAIDFSALLWYNSCIKSEKQKPVGWKDLKESCRLVRDNGGVLLEFILLAVYWIGKIRSRLQRAFPL